MLDLMPAIVATLVVVGALVVIALSVPRWVQNYAPTVPQPAPGTVRVACVGDSITFGLLVWPRRKNCYPAQLQRQLGERYSVGNFGANGCAVHRGADRPYWDHRYFRMSADYQPNIVLLMLGTNDARAPNWKGVADYERDYRDLIAHYQALPSRPVVVAMTPPAQFRVKGEPKVRYGMVESSIPEMAAAIKHAAADLGVPVIDVHAQTLARPDTFAFDGIHINAKGGAHIAAVVMAGLERANLIGAIDANRQAGSAGQSQIGAHP
jgi:acyl-CoA thioesterase I